MKILLTSICDNNNIGTYLQVYALGEVLKTMGHQVQVVNYVRPGLGYDGIIKDRMFKKEPLTRRLAATLYGLAEYWWVRRRYQGFIRSKVSLTKEYHHIDELTLKFPKADVYMTGSDQVWNSKYNCGVDRVMYLDYAPPGSKKVAYASSFGISEIPDKEKEETARLLAAYHHISVRESSCMKLLESVGRNDGVHVLDPTLLLDKTWWSVLARESRLDIKDKYVLVYSAQLECNGIAVRLARRVAEKLAVRVWMVTPNGFRSRIPDCDHCVTFALPQDFLALFLKAEFIVCSSFHGTAFSVSLNKSFLSILPPRFGSRMKDLLDSCGLEDRLIDTEDVDLDVALKLPDFSKANAYIKEGRRKSSDFLLKALKDEE